MDQPTKKPNWMTNPLWAESVGKWRMWFSLVQRHFPTCELAREWSKARQSGMEQSRTERSEWCKWATFSPHPMPWFWTQCNETDNEVTCQSHDVRQKLLYNIDWRILMRYHCAVDMGIFLQIYPIQSLPVAVCFPTTLDIPLLKKMCTRYLTM